MNTRKRLRKDFERMEIPSKERILPHTAKAGAAAPHPRRAAPKRWMAAPMVVAMAILLSLSVAAAGGIILSQINARMLTGNNTQLTEVPEGYVGIYTVEDLVELNQALRSQEDLPVTHYILMNDIIFTDEHYAEGGICEGGWDGATSANRYSDFHMRIYEPDAIDSEYQVCFINGNGHVIRNLKIHVDANEYLSPVVYPNRDFALTKNALFVGLFASMQRRYLQIINLGIEGCEIDIRGNDLPIFYGFSGNDDFYDICVGAIAASAEYIGGCYVKDYTLNIDFRNCYLADNEAEPFQYVMQKYHTYGIGSLVGYAKYVDACYAENAEMHISVDSEEPFSTLYAGGIAGHATTCLTSWSSCDIQVSGNGLITTVTDGIVPELQSAMIPQIVPEQAFADLQEVLAEEYGADSFTYKRLMAYFVRKEIQANSESAFERWNRVLGKFSGRDEVSYDVLYLYDPTTPPRISQSIADQIISAFESEEAYRMFCAEHNIMLGQLYCYTLETEQTVTEADAVGFDFETLWQIRDGRPRLRIFEN